MKIKLLVVAALGLAADSLYAEESWDWEITPYLWAAGIDGTASVGNVSASVSADFSDILDVLQGGALLRFEGTKGANGVFGDIVFLALEKEDARDGVGGPIELDLDSLIVEGGYRRFLSPGFAIDFGARYWDFDTKLTPSLLPVVRKSNSWTDGFVGARFSGSGKGPWSWVFRGNVGAGGADLALGLEVDLRREFSNGNQLSLGFRALDLDFENSSGIAPSTLDMTFAGLTLGYTFDL